MHTALQLPALISRSAMRHDTENGVSLMDVLRMMKFMFAVPQGSNHFSALSSNWHGMALKPEHQTMRNLQRTLETVNEFLKLSSILQLDFFRMVPSTEDLIRANDIFCKDCKVIIGKFVIFGLYK